VVVGLYLLDRLVDRWVERRTDGRDLGDPRAADHVDELLHDHREPVGDRLHFGGALRADDGTLQVVEDGEELLQQVLAAGLAGVVDVTARPFAVVVEVGGGADPLILHPGGLGAGVREGVDHECGSGRGARRLLRGRSLSRRGGGNVGRLGGGLRLGLFVRRRAFGHGKPCGGSLRARSRLLARGITGNVDRRLIDRPGPEHERGVSTSAPAFPQQRMGRHAAIARASAGSYGVGTLDVTQLTPTRSPLDAELNPPQADAVAHSRGPLLVFAGAGSGKTRVITYRIANLVACERVPPYRILAVTFTNKAAGEMRDRLGRLLGEGLAKDLWVGTFHATSAKLLRRYGEALGLAKNFVIYDTDDQKAVVTRALRALDLDDKRYPPRLCLGAIHKEKQELRGPDDMAVGDPWLPRIFRAYEEQLRAANAVDFEDLIGLMVKLLEENPAGAGDALRKRFDFVLVDEFQDTNAAQYRFLKAFVRDHRNLCVVGDDDQSIYRWRGADVRNIRGFKQDFPDASVVKLEQNYRSTGRIVRAALGVIEKSSERVPKDLWTANAEGAPIEIVATKDERDEAAYVLGVIQEARARGVDPKEMAVFYRVHAQSRVLEEAMRSANVPYQIVGGTKFYDRAEIKNALSYLRVLTNPASDIDLLRVINTPARGIGATTIERLSALAKAEHVSLSGALAIVGAPRGAGEVAAKKAGLGTAATRLLALHKLLESLRAEMVSLRPSDVLGEVLERSGYVAALLAENSAESEARIENLAELKSSVFDYEQEAVAAGELVSVEGYLERVSLQSDVDGMKDASRVTLMTVHGAKGLEFEVVVLTGMEQDMFPYRGMNPTGEHEVEEERRLAYVAITRARSRLIVTHTDTRQIFGTTRLGGPSPFLALMPKDSVILKSTAARGASSLGRFVDRGGDHDGDDGGYRAPRSGRAWEHPQGAPPRVVPSDVGPGERYVDREFFDDSPMSEDGVVGLRRGSRVLHAQFGLGEVRSVVQANEPAVLVAFAGRGEKKILVRFLKPA